ncbi:hypothetical protein ACVWYH_000673 [Bradyrhizobium sp. GM24.11]
MASSIRRAAAEFVLRLCRAGTTMISRIVVPLADFRIFTRDQQLLPHFSETGTAIFDVEQVEYGGHDHPHRLTVAIEIFPSRISG